MFLKVCGLTRLTDALHAVQQGATAVGFVFWPGSARYIAPDRAAAIIAELPSSVMAVGVFVNETPDRIRTIAANTGLSAVQLHGDEPPAFADAIAWPVLRSVTLESAAGACQAWPPETTLLLDAADPERRGGTGQVIDWTRAAGVARLRRIVLAGGLTAANVGDAIRTVRPFGVDVSSGVEESPGVKSFEKVTQFLMSARGAFDERVTGR
jgi:phosphoribosylanthranilate isomerase